MNFLVHDVHDTGGAGTSIWEWTAACEKLGGEVDGWGWELSISGCFRSGLWGCWDVQWDSTAMYWLHGMLCSLGSPHFLINICCTWDGDFLCKFFLSCQRRIEPQNSWCFSAVLQEKERDHFSHFVTESFTAYCKRKRRDKVKTFATNGGLEIGGFSH
jgi:hypothetical protein